MDARLSLTLKSSLAEIARLSREFGQFAARHGLSTDVGHAVNLALEELVTNIIRHGSSGRDDLPIGVEIAVEPAEVLAAVEDWGPPFDPLQTNPPDLTLPLEQRSPGGLGIHLTRKLMDAVQYARVDGKNRVELRKAR